MAGILNRSGEPGRTPKIFAPWIRGFGPGRGARTTGSAAWAHPGRRAPVARTVSSSRWPRRAGPPVFELAVVVGFMIVVHQVAADRPSSRDAISSRVIPLVSGRRRRMKTNPSRQIAA